jgi:ZIP family zinc transporter
MMQTYVAVIVLAFLSGITTLIGVALAFFFKKSVKGVVIGVGFSAGIMLALSFFELLPESIAATTKIKAISALILGFLFILILHFIIPHTHLGEEKGKLGKVMRIGLLVAFGMILHDFPEGFAMANSYIFAPSLGILVAISIALHNIPEEFAMAIPLVLTKKKWFLIKLALLSALAEPLGAIVGLFAVSLAPALNPLFMAFAAGAMIFISINELLPLAKIYKRTDLFVVGIALSLLVYLALTLFIPG